MSTNEILILVIKSAAVGLLLGAIAYRTKGRSFAGWTAVGAAAAAIFPGLPLLALVALALLPKKPK